METKECKKCGKNLPTDMFWKRTYSSGTVGLQNKCKSCQSKGRVKYYKPHQLIRDMLKISNEEYEGLMINTHCNICHKELERKCIDHCHETKKSEGCCVTTVTLPSDYLKITLKLCRMLSNTWSNQSNFSLISRC